MFLRTALLTFFPCLFSWLRVCGMPAALLTTGPHAWGCRAIPHQGGFASASLTSWGNACKQLLSPPKSQGVNCQHMRDTPQTLGMLNFCSPTTMALSAQQILPIPILVTTPFPCWMFFSVSCGASDVQVVTQDKWVTPGFLGRCIIFGACSNMAFRVSLDTGSQEQR